MNQTVILKRTLSRPEIVILFTGTPLACHYYVCSNAGTFEVVNSFNRETK